MGGAFIGGADGTINSLNRSAVAAVFVSIRIRLPE
jgi:hypothetical protein